MDAGDRASSAESKKKRNPWKEMLVVIKEARGRKDERTNNNPGALGV